MNKFKYKSIFASPISKVGNVELDRYLSVANLQNLKSLMPKEIDLQNNPDLIGICLNAAVANRVNKNGDCITNETATKLAKTFLWKFCDSSHNRNRLVGTICN